MLFSSSVTLIPAPAGNKLPQLTGRHIRLTVREQECLAAARIQIDTFFSEINGNIRPFERQSLIFPLTVTNRCC